MTYKQILFTNDDTILYWKEVFIVRCEEFLSHVYARSSLHYKHSTIEDIFDYKLNLFMKHERDD